MLEVNPKIHPSWLNRLQNEFNSDYFKELTDFLTKERSEFQIYPDSEATFEAFNLTPFENVKVVILGQDPYHGPNQAHGLSFSVKKGVKQPPSLKNIFKELSNDLNISPPEHGDLTNWAKQGVLLLNATLTVKAQTPGSHQKKGWEKFTDRVISIISEERENLVFVLWGKYAQDKGAVIDSKKHFIISSPHPSPFAAHRGFFESKPFSKTNDFLQSKGINPVDWKL